MDSIGGSGTEGAMSGANGPLPKIHKNDSCGMETPCFSCRVYKKN